MTSPSCQKFKAAKFRQTKPYKFASQWDGGEKDGIITKEEFSEYYANVGAGIENDSYFELMIRNAWHISGGEGWQQTTAAASLSPTLMVCKPLKKLRMTWECQHRHDAMKRFLESKGMKVAKSACATDQILHADVSKKIGRVCFL